MGLAVVGPARRRGAGPVGVRQWLRGAFECLAREFAAAPRRQMQIWSAQGLATIDFAVRTASMTRPSETLLRRELDIESLTAAEKQHLKERLFDEHLPTENLEVAQANALVDELQDLCRSIRTGLAPRVTGEQGREALAVAQQILAQINTHAWHGDAAGPVGPLVSPQVDTVPMPILRGPHWDRTPSLPPQHREAG